LENVTEYKNCAFSLQRIFQTFIILRGIQRDIIINTSSLHIQHTLFLSDFQKLSKLQISWKSIQWKQFFHADWWRDRQTDMTEL